MSTQDTFIRSAVDSCLPQASIADKYKWRKRLAQALEDRKNGFDITTRSLWAEPNAHLCRMVRVYNAALHQHLRAECD